MTDDDDKTYTDLTAVAQLVHDQLEKQTGSCIPFIVLTLNGEQGNPQSNYISNMTDRGEVMRALESLVNDYKNDMLETLTPAPAAIH